MQNNHYILPSNHLDIYLNLGCGSRYHPEWLNIDIMPHAPEVIQHDLSRGIPLPDATCDVVYHAAVLEHMRRVDAAAFMVECYRVLKPSGIIRVGVPDLEKICRLYLSTLATALAGDEVAARNYDWILLEMYDQTVRERKGGAMLAYLQQNSLPNESFIYERIGEEGRHLVNALRRQNDHSTHTSAKILHKLRWKVRSLPERIKRSFLQWLLGADGWQALEIGRFRLIGEVHQWMYDRYSLDQLLHSIGFQDTQLQSATTSRIPNWTSFYLDTTPDGEVIKPDLFFMEATKPRDIAHD